MEGTDDRIVEMSSMDTESISSKGGVVEREEEFNLLDSASHLLSDEKRGDVSPSPSSPASPRMNSSDRTWQVMEKEGIFFSLAKRPYLIPLFLIFVFFYFGLLSVVLYIVFDPQNIRASEPFVSLVLSVALACAYKWQKDHGPYLPFVFQN
jgi:hypothetical protein